ncbi:MAG: hypothetical protein Kow0074_23330 [Candidatus Zixiibacteriota bacterium]
MNLIKRVIAVAMNPKREWPLIADETTSPGELYSKVIVVLVAIAPVCSAINSAVFGQSIPFTDVTVRPSVGAIMGSMILTYVLTLISVFVMAFIVQKLAPTFQSVPDFTQALKLVTWSYAPVWVAGVLNLIPFLGVLTLFVGLYGIYLAYVGLPSVMKTPPDKAVPYLIVVIVVSIIVWIVIGAISAAVVGVGAWTAGSTMRG